MNRQSFRSLVLLFSASLINAAKPTTPLNAAPQHPEVARGDAAENEGGGGEEGRGEGEGAVGRMMMAGGRRGQERERFPTSPLPAERETSEAVILTSAIETREVLNCNETLLR